MQLAVPDIQCFKISMFITLSGYDWLTKCPIRNVESQVDQKDILLNFITKERNSSMNLSEYNRIAS